jgi:hypothetical protein
VSEVLLSIPTALIWIGLTMLIVRNRDAMERRYVWLSLFAHLFCAVFMVVITTYYYGGGDLTAYFWTGKFLAVKLRADFMDLAPTLIDVILQREVALPFPGAFATGTNTGSMQALSGFLVYFFQESLYATCVAIAGASFWAKVAVYDVIKQELPDAPQGLLRFACLLLPSSVLWSSGLLKEPFAVLGLSAMICGGHKLAAKRMRSPLAALLFLAGLITTGLFKGYIVPVFGLAAGAWYVVRAIQQRYGAILTRGRYLIMGVGLAVGTLMLTSIALPQFAPDILTEEAQSAQQIGSRISGGSNYALNSGSVGEQVPLAVATVFFRPLLIEASNPLILLSSLEMTWLLVLVLTALFRRRLSRTLGQIMSTPALAFCASFALIMSVGVGLTTTNLGTLSRYRMPMMVFYVVLVVTLSARERKAAPSEFPSIAPPSPHLT